MSLRPTVIPMFRTPRTMTVCSPLPAVGRFHSCRYEGAIPAVSMVLNLP